MMSEKYKIEDAQKRNRRRPRRAVEDFDCGGRKDCVLQPSEMHPSLAEGV